MGPTVRVVISALYALLTWRNSRSHAQLLSTNKCLLVADGPSGLGIWLFALHAGFSLQNPTRTIASAPGRRFELAVDEQRKVVAFVIMEPVSCNSFL